MQHKRVSKPKEQKDKTHLSFTSPFLTNILVDKTVVFNLHHHLNNMKTESVVLWRKMLSSVWLRIKGIEEDLGFRLRP